jgi:Domain of unknown function (DUF4430)
VTRSLCLAVAAVTLAGCGFGSESDGGKATLWITRDRGKQVVLVRKVAAGQTAMVALQKAANVETRYGGRYVQSIDGVAGSLAKQRDWLYFINGYEADRGAADYKLRPGDVEWWDYRSWKGRAIHVPVVVGAFPEPFLHGYGGNRRAAAVVFERRELAPLAKRLGKLIHARSVSPDEPHDANVLVLSSADVPFSATTKNAGDPVRFVLGPTAARRLLANRKLARFRYSGLW